MYYVYIFITIYRVFYKCIAMDHDLSVIVNDYQDF